ncbi:hypothetical protein D9M69_395440 [compost metagenome]
MAVEKALLQQAALVGHVELAALGIDQRHQGGLENVEGEDRFVDLPPEGMPMLALDARVGAQRMHQMGQGIGEDHHRR